MLGAVHSILPPFFIGDLHLLAADMLGYVHSILPPFFVGVFHFITGKILKLKKN
jgi:hypothetical protein